MGIFCGILKNPNASIPIERREEFLTRLTELFYRGGMFAFDYRNLFDHTIIVLKKAEPVDGGIGFDYNYFEDDFFEEPKSHNFLKIILLILAIIVFAGVIFYFIKNYGIGA